MYHALSCDDCFKLIHYLETVHVFSTYFCTRLVFLKMIIIMFYIAQFPFLAQCASHKKGRHLIKINNQSRT